MDTITFLQAMRRARRLFVSFHHPDGWGRFLPVTKTSVTESGVRDDLRDTKGISDDGVWFVGETEGERQLWSFDADIGHLTIG